MFASHCLITCHGIPTHHHHNNNNNNHNNHNNNNNSNHFTLTLTLRVDHISDAVATQCLAVEYDNVSFEYPARCDAPAGSTAGRLTGVSLRVPCGVVWAILGRNGSGKSTLLQLAPRLRDVCDGSVRVMGVDVRGVRQRDLRRVVVMVGQQASLLKRTVRENLVLGCEGEYRATAA